MIIISTKAERKTSAFEKKIIFNKHVLMLSEFVLNVPPIQNNLLPQ